MSKKKPIRTARAAQQCAARWSPASRLSLSFHRATLEALETRLCLATAVYNYPVIAQTGDAGISGISGGPSINKNGTVAFVGQLADGSQAVFAGSAASLDQPTNISSSSLSDDQLLSERVQINDSGAIPAVDRTPEGVYELRTWNATATPPTSNVIDTASAQDPSDSGLVSFFNTTAVNNNGNVVYLGDEEGTTSVIMERDGEPIASLPAGQTALNPMIADNGAVVFRNDENTANPAQNPIVLLQSGQPLTVIANTQYFDSLGASPGISPDGQIVAFYGDLNDNGAKAINAEHMQQTPSTAGPGIFLSIATGGTRALVQVAGETSQDALQPGESFVDFNAQGNAVATNNNGVFDPGETKIGVSAFDPDTRVAVNSVDAAGGVTVVFMGTDSTTGNDALFCNRVDFFSKVPFSPTNPQSFRVNIDTVIAEVGDAINNVGTSVSTIGSLAIYDPLNNKGQVAFEVAVGGGTKAIVVADPVPVLAVTRYSQANPEWQSQPYAGGGPKVSIPKGEGGSGYTSAPEVTFSAPPVGQPATGEASIKSGSVASVDVTPGGFYFTPPTITFTGGGGSGVSANVGLYTFANSACALSTLASTLDYAGYPNLSYPGGPFGPFTLTGDPFDPYTLNGLLVSQFGYLGHSIDFPRDTYIAANESGVPGLTFNESKKNSPSVSDLTTLLQQHHPVIVKVTDKNGDHYVVVTGVSHGQFTIVDPGFAFEPNTTNYQTPPTLADYNNTFTIRGYIADPTDISDLTVAIVGAGQGANILVTNAQGQQTGTDADTASTSQDIPQSVTYDDAPEFDLTGGAPAETVETVDVNQPQAGPYTFTVTGATAEPFTLSVSPIAPDGSLLTPQVITGTVTPGTPQTYQFTYDPGTNLPRVSISDVSEAKTQSGSADFDFTVTLSSQPTQAVTLDYATADNTATVANNDYQATSGSLTFTPGGLLTQTIEVPVNGNTVDVPDETFFVNLTNVVNAAMEKTVGVGTIQNDDTPISIGDVTQTQGTTAPATFAFTISLPAPSSLPISVDYSTQDGTATVADGDYQPQIGTVTFQPGETTKTVSITVNPDPNSEPQEVFYVNLSNPVNGALTAGSDQGIGTVVNVAGTGTKYYVNDASTAGDIYCTAPGSDNNDGLSPSTPLASINAVMNSYTLHPGDTIYVDTGTYTLPTNIVLKLQDSGVSIIGAGQRQPQPTLNPSVILADNPVAFWPLGETSGTTAVDATGNGYNGTYVAGLTHVTGGPSASGAASFNGTNQYITVPNSPAVDTTQFSVGAWINFQGIGSDDPLHWTILSKSTDGYSNGYRLGIDSVNEVVNGIVVSQPQLTFATYAFQANAPLPTAGGWVYVVGTYDGNATRLYINGQLKSEPAPVSIFPSSAPLEIGNGAVDGNPNTPFAGAIADVAYYDTTLTGDQVSAHYEAVQESGTLLDRGNASTGSYAFELNGAQNVTLANMSITGANVGIYADGNTNSTGLTVSNVDVGGCLQAGIDIESGNDGELLTRDTVHGNGAVGWPNSGIYFDSNNNTVVDCTAFANTFAGIMSTGANETYTGNTVFNNGHAAGSDGSGGIVVYRGGTDNIVGNDAFANSAGIQMEGFGTSTATNNVVHDNVGGGIGAGWAEVTANEVYNNGGAGIGLGSAADAVNNVVYGNHDGIVQAGTYVPFEGFSSSADNIVGNRVFDNQGVGIQALEGIIKGNVTYSNSVGIEGAGQSPQYGPNFISLEPFLGTIANNLSYANPAGAIEVIGASNAVITNNTAVSATGDAVHVTSLAYNDPQLGPKTLPSTNVSLSNNILEADTGYGIYVSNDSQQGFSSDYNLFYSTGGGKVGFWQSDFSTLQSWYLNIDQDPHSISANPLFVDAAAGDFHLQNGSPAIAAGDPSSDFSAQPMPAGGRINLGAYGDTPEATTIATAGVVIKQTGGSTQVVLGGADDTYALVLTSPPTADVTINVIPDSSLAVTPSTLTYTAADWNVAQTVTVHAVESHSTGTITHTATSSDSRYNGIPIPSLTVQIVQTTPAPATIDSASQAAFTIGETNTFTVVAGGNPTPILTQTGPLPSGVTFNKATGVLGGTPDSGTDGTYAITFTAHNGYGADATQSFTLSVEQSTAPTITSTDSAIFVVGAFNTFAVAARGFPAPTLSETGTLPEGVTFDAATGVLSGVPIDSTGRTYNVSFTAHNGIGTDATQNFTLTTFIGTPPKPLTLVPIGDQTSEAGKTISFQASASEADAAATLVFSLDAPVPNGAAIDRNTGVFTWTPTAAQSPGDYTITVRVTDDGQPAQSATSTFRVHLAPHITISDVSAAKPESGTAVFNFQVSLSSPVATAVTMNVATADGTATTDLGDYQPVSGTLTFLPGGPLTQTIGVPVFNDNRVEPNEAFFVNLTSVEGADVAVAHAVGTILGIQGKSYYVNDASTSGDDYCTAPGSDANTGTSSGDPMANLSALLRRYTFSAGDTIYVDTGNYDLLSNAVLGLQQSGVRIVGPYSGSAVFNRDNQSSGSYALQLAGATNVTIENLTLTGAQYGIYAADGAASTGSTVVNCSISGMSAEGIYIGTSNDDLSLFDNKVQGAANNGIDVHSNGATIVHNTSSGNANVGINVEGNSATVNGNTAYKNGNAATGGTGIDVLGTEATISGNIVYANNAVGITLDNGGNGGVVSGNVVYDNTVFGIRTIHGGLVTNNTVYGQTSRSPASSSEPSTGLYLAGGEASWNTVYGNIDGIYDEFSALVDHNRVFGNLNTGIEASYQSQVEGNTVYSNSVGILADNSADPFTGTISNNLVYADTQCGIQLISVISAQVVNNTVYETHCDAIDIQTSARNINVVNNILWVQSGYDLNIAQDSEQGFSSDYNDLQTSDNGQVAVWENQPLATLTAWFDGVGQDQHSISADPQFFDPAGPDGVLGFNPKTGLDGGGDDDFRLRAGSPAIAAGNPASDFSQQPVPTGGRIELGAYGDTPQATPSAAAAVFIYQPGGSTNVAVGGADGTYTVVLTSQPTADVTIVPQTDRQLSVSPASLTFSTANWNVAQTITVHDVSDIALQPVVSFPISHTATSADARYQGIAVPNATVYIINSAMTATLAPATITSSNAAPFTVGNSGSFTVTAAGSPMPVLSESGALPTGVSFDSATGVLSGTPAAGSAPTYTISFTAHNGVGTDFEQTLTISVNPVTAPSFDIGPNRTLDENAGPQSVAGWATQILLGSDTSIAFVITSDSNASLFAVPPAINATTGTLTVTPAANTTGSATIAVELQGQTAGGTQNNSAPQTFTITVNQVTAPSFAVGPNKSIDENDGPQSAAGWATQILPGSDGSIAFVTTSDSNASLFAVPPAINATTGTMTFTPAANTTGSATIAVELQGQTASGTQNNSAQQTFTITVNQVTAPSFAVGPNKSIDENAGPQSVAGWATQILLGSDTSIAFVTTSDSNPSLFAVPPAINATTGTMTFTPAANTTGSATIAVELQGQTAGGTQNNSAPQSFTLTVNPGGNQPPTFTAGANQTVAENAGPQTVTAWATNIAPSGAALAFVVTGNTDPSLFSAPPAVDASGTLTYTPATNATGTATVTLVLNENGGQQQSPPQSFTITVNFGGPTRTPNQRYVAAVYEDVLQRAPDAGGLQYWANLLDQAQQAGTLSSAVSSVAMQFDHSAEYYQNFVIKPTYLSLLGRAADGSGLQYWTAQMLGGLTDQELEAGFIASAEFYDNAGGTDSAWVAAAYKLLLGRAPDATGATYWVSQLAALESTESAVQARSQISLRISNSQENDTNLINQDYFHYLGRAADASGLAFWLQQFAAGDTNEDVIAGFTGSAEYYKDKTGVSP